MPKSKIFLWLCLSFIGGVALRSWLAIGNFPAYLAFLACLVLAIVFCLPAGEAGPNQKIRLIGFAGTFLLLGILRFNWNLPVINSGHIAFYNNRSINFSGLVAKEPDQRLNHTKLTIGDISIAGRAVKGQVLVSVNLYPAYHYGDKLKISGVLRAPGRIEDFDYDQYLARYDIYSVCYYPRIDLLAENQGNRFYQAILEIKNNLQAVINQGLIEPQASLLSAMVLGERGNITQELRDQFAKAGISHIIAISGLHITIIAGLLMNLMMFLYIGRRRGFYLAVFGLIFFIILIGAPASAVRAGIMGFSFLLARQVGRLSQSLNALVLAAALMLLINPLLLKSDVGFQLSFLAVLGLIYFQPYLARIKAQARDQWQIRSSVELTLSAQAMTLPWLTYVFGQLSVVAPLANVLILPILPFLMMLGLSAALIGLVYLPLAKIVFGLVWLFLSYIIKIVALVNVLPFASWQIKFPLWLAGVVYLIIFVWLLGKKRKL